jgi:hypothetical protein
MLFGRESFLSGSRRSVMIVEVDGCCLSLVFCQPNPEGLPINQSPRNKTCCHFDSRAE